MEALSEALRMELSGSRIQVSCIEPGLVMTELHNHWEVHPSKSMNIPEPLTVEDIVRTVGFIMDLLKDDPDGETVANCIHPGRLSSATKPVNKPPK
jgi:NADP-dependent 3-hydroxy acid dehydrogenase YdfG